MTALANTNGTTGPLKSARTQQETRQQFSGIVAFQSVPEFIYPCPPGSFDVYREMLRQPTVALCWNAKRALCKAPKWSVESEDNCPDAVTEYVEEHFIKRKMKILNHMLTAMNFQNAYWEKGWTIPDGRYSLEMRPLKVDLSLPITQQRGGGIIGVENQGTRLGLRKAACYRYDHEASDPFGQSRLENIRATAYRGWMDTFLKLTQYTRKVAGVVPVVTMPMGNSADPDGTIEQNQKLAQMLLDGLTGCKGVVWPTVIPEWAKEMLIQNPELAKYILWSISFLEVTPGHGTELIENLAYHDKNIVRGYFGPERAITEGQFGTKAESETQGDFVILEAEQWVDEACEWLNENCVDDALEAAFGPWAIGLARVSPGPLQDSEKTYFRTLLHDLALAPASLEVAATIWDMDAMSDQAGFPKAQDTINVADISAVVQPPTLPGQAPGGDPNADPSPDDAQNDRQKRALAAVYSRVLTQIRGV